MVLLCVDASIFASFGFAHLHVSMAADICPPPGAATPAWGWPAGAMALLLLGSAVLETARRRFARAERQTVVRAATVLAMACAAAALALEAVGHQNAGLAPTADAWSATVAALLGWQGLHIAIVLLMGSYLLARSLSDHLRPRARATLDNTVLFWHYVTVQGLVGSALVQGLPMLM